MTSSTSPVDVCNLALSQAGVRAAITSVFPSDGTAAGDACALLYQPTIDAYARAAHWNCLRFQSGAPGSTFPPPLSLLKAAAGTPENPGGTTLPVPPQPWLYEYGLPADCLKVRFLVPLLTQPSTSPPLTTGGGMMLPRIMPATAIPFTPAVDLDANGNEIAVILTNLRHAQAVYTRRLINVGLWDSQFLMGAKAALAVWLSPALKGSAAAFQLAMGIAKGTLDAARVSDGNEGPQTQDHVPDWIAIRSGGRGLGGGAGQVIAPWDGFAFPGGVTY
jgi:hypothetical protein